MALGRAKWAPGRKSKQRVWRVILLDVEQGRRSTPKHDCLIGTGDRGVFLTCLVTRLLSALRSKIQRWPEDACRLGSLCGWSLQHCAASRLQSTSKSLAVPSYFLSAAVLSLWLPQACLCLFTLPLLSSDMPFDGSSPVKSICLSSDNSAFSWCRIWRTGRAWLDAWKEVGRLDPHREESFLLQVCKGLGTAGNTCGAT